MQIPRSYIENYSKALNVVSERARAALVDALSQIDYTADVATVREAVIAVMQPACGASSTVAARVAADFYDGLRAQFGIDDGYLAQVDSRRVPEATEGAVRAFAQDLVDNKPTEQFIGKCADRIDYETRRAANECIAYNAKNDPKKPRWARIPTGAETCSFCIMLASRGFVYHSEETASHAHAHCDCRVVPSWDRSNPLVQGYDPDEYYDRWKHPEKYQNASQNNSTQQPKYTFSQFKTKKDAVSYLRDEFGFEKVSTGLTIDELNEVARSFTAYFNKFPFMVGVVKEIKTGKMKAAAYYSSNETRTKTGQKTFNPVFKFDRASIRSASSDCAYCCDPSNFASGYRWWSTKSGIDGIVMHEGVHAVEYKVLMKRAGFSEGDVISPVDAFKFRMRRGEVSKEVVEEAFKRCNIPYTDENVCKHISEYGSKNTLETLAEALSCEDNSNKVCNTIKDVFDELLQKEGFL